MDVANNNRTTSLERRLKPKTKRLLKPIKAKAVGSGAETPSRNQKSVLG
jgi:hypothetical protein